MGMFFSKVWHTLFQLKIEARILMLGLDAAGKTTILYKLKLGETAVTIPTIGFNVETVTYKTITFTIWDVGGQKLIRNLWYHYFPGTKGKLSLNSHWYSASKCLDFYSILSKNCQKPGKFFNAHYYLVLIRSNFMSVKGNSKMKFRWRFNFIFWFFAGLVYVVDSNDRERLAEAKEELWVLLDADELRDAKLLVFANKQVWYSQIIIIIVVSSFVPIFMLRFQDLPNALKPSEITEGLGLHTLSSNRKWHVQATCAINGAGIFEGLDWLGNEIMHAK